jgi:superfamily II DNA or RNA helicase
MTALWPHQSRGVNAVFDAIDAGERALCLTSPTGMGKSRMACEIIERLADHGWRAVLYTNRCMLVEQIRGVLDRHGIPFGVRAAGYGREGHWPVQVSSLPTEVSRVLKRKTWDIHGAGHRGIAIVDEAHLNNGDGARAILRRHRASGHVILGVTATPLDLGDTYSHLIVAGTASEGRACGALVEARCWDFGAPDLGRLQKRRPEYRDGADVLDVTEAQAAEVMGFGREATKRALMGRIWDGFNRLNPDRRPTICFGPDVAGSLWIAEQFWARGITAAHIDGEFIWVNGDLERTSPELRQQVLDASRCGDIAVLCNRFVLREGIDCPWLSHGILATVFDGLKTYLQSGGRLLRAYPGLEAVTIQDHGGNWVRHGSLNEDREWFLEQTSAMAYALRAERLRRKERREPFRCPKCGLIWVWGTYCNPARGGCGHTLDPRRKSRPVVMADGTIREVTGDYFRPRRTYARPDGAALWERMYWRSRTGKGRRTFRAAAALFAQENDWRWPDPTWPLMPTHQRDWYLSVDQVPMERLVPKPEAVRL